MATDLTADKLRATLKYDPETGVFLWATARKKTRVGEVAGCVNVLGYVQICIDRRLYTGHRLAFLHMTGAWPKCEVDHINGQRSDNRWANLRDVSRQSNSENKRHACKNSKTGILGVTKIGRRYQAAIKVGGKQRKLGYFDTAEQASAAYISAKRQHHPGCTL